jgi:hypothetical protein
MMFGGRTYDKGDKVEKEIKRVQSVALGLGRELLLITGGAGGADTLVETIGKLNNCHVARIDALWDTRHNGAGPQRNGVMVALDPHEAVCFHANIAKSRGSASSLRILHDHMRRHGHKIPVKTVK